MRFCFDIIEAEDRDMGCVVSSLVQVMCDPHCRTQHGFQSLVQKEWVVAGHRFYSRINYHRDNDKEEVRGQTWNAEIKGQWIKRAVIYSSGND